MLITVTLSHGFRFKVANQRHFVSCSPATTSCMLMYATASYTTSWTPTLPMVSIHSAYSRISAETL